MAFELENYTPKGDVNLDNLERIQEENLQKFVDDYNIILSGEGTVWGELIGADLNKDIKEYFAQINKYYEDVLKGLKDIADKQNIQKEKETQQKREQQKLELKKNQKEEAEKQEDFLSKQVKLISAGDYQPQLIDSELYESFNDHFQDISDWAMPVIEKANNLKNSLAKQIPSGNTVAVTYEHIIDETFIFSVNADFVNTFLKRLSDAKRIVKSSISYDTNKLDPYFDQLQEDFTRLKEITANEHPSYKHYAKHPGNFQYFLFMTTHDSFIQALQKYTQNHHAIEELVKFFTYNKTMEQILDKIKEFNNDNNYQNIPVDIKLILSAHLKNLENILQYPHDSQSFLKRPFEVIQPAPPLAEEIVGENRELSDMNLNDFFTEERLKNIENPNDLENLRTTILTDFAFALGISIYIRKKVNESQTEYNSRIVRFLSSKNLTMESKDFLDGLETKYSQLSQQFKSKPAAEILEADNNDEEVEEVLTDVERILTINYIPAEDDYTEYFDKYYNFQAFFNQTINEFLEYYNKLQDPKDPLQYEKKIGFNIYQPNLSFQDFQQNWQAKLKWFPGFFASPDGKQWQQRINQLFIIHGAVNSDNHYYNQSFEIFQKEYVTKTCTSELLTICNTYYSDDEDNNFGFQSDNDAIKKFLISKKNAEVTNKVNQALRKLKPNEESHENHKNSTEIINKPTNSWFALKVVAAVVAATLLLALSLTVLAPVIAALGFAVGPGLAMIAGAAALLTVSATAATGIMLGLGTLLAVASGVVAGVTIGVVAAKGFFGQPKEGGAGKGDIADDWYVVKDDKDAKI